MKLNYSTYREINIKHLLPLADNEVKVNVVSLRKAKFLATKFMCDLPTLL